jgi:hypothetical protein
VKYKTFDERGDNVKKNCIRRGDNVHQKKFV